MIYLDTSAVVKLLRRETETDALVKHLDAHPDHNLLTSALTTVEATRALTAIGAADVAARAIRRSDHIEIGDSTIPAVSVTATVLDLARTVPPAVLRSLDAIHLATALLAGDDLHHLITYDKRMIAAAEAVGLRTSTPS
ncbi:MULTISPECIES: type II toxin-antitoxin system VapC family toxin [unclassified Frankia]|uniref:type II toxin-antitoxin system VapC family toxin n=1 Tax=unclassified Frankia TaxID=2632575 RepID=UPI002AD54A4E|nr:MULTISPECIES: type II toxin-antitoxin system VapC family toxin [unclassified Frankia]